MNSHFETSVATAFSHILDFGNNHLNISHLKEAECYQNSKFEIYFMLISCVFFMNYIYYHFYFCSEII